MTQKGGERVLTAFLIWYVKIKSNLLEKGRRVWYNYP
jgi:hypothetical protein